MSSGFAQGFKVGFNAVDSVVRQKYERDRQAKLDKRDEERWSFEKDRMERERQKAADLAAAGQAPSQGVAVGQPGARNFAAGADDQAFLKDQDAAIAEMEGRAPGAAQAAVNAGGQIVDSSDPRAQDSKQGYLARVAGVQRKYGDVAGSLTTEDLSNRIEREGYKDALDYLLATGDAEGAQKRFNGTGKSQLGGKLVATPAKRVGSNGVEMPDFTLSLDDGKGGVRQLGSALAMRFMADNPAEYIKLLNQEKEGQLRERGVINTEKATDASIRQGDRRLDLTERQQQEQSRHNRAQEGIAGARLKLELDKHQDELTGAKFDRQIQQIEKVLGRPLTETEKLAKLGFKNKDGESKFVDDVAKEWAKGNPEAKPQDIANFKADLTRQVRAAPAALEIEGRIKALPSGQRAEAISEAKQKFRLSDEWFAARGIAIPAQPPAAANMATQSGGAAPGPAMSPAQAAVGAQPRQMGPQEESYNRAVTALRAQQQQLARRAASANPDEQVAISNQINALGAQVVRTQDEARRLGIVVQ